MAGQDLRDRTFGIYDEVDKVARHIDSVHERMWRLKPAQYMSAADRKYYDDVLDKAEDKLLAAKKLIAQATDYMGMAVATVDPYVEE